MTRPPGTSAASIPRTRQLLGVTLGVTLLAALVATGRIPSIQVILLATLIPSIVVHELAHVGFAHLLGDRGIHRRRLTIHGLIDPLGTLVVPSLLVLGSIGWFGWARSVPIDTGLLRWGRNGRIAVALAGPLTSAILSILCSIGFGVVTSANATAVDLPFGAKVLFGAGLANLSLAVINLLPVPPLDGSLLLERALPSQAWPRYLKVRRFLLPGLIGLVVANLMFNLTIVEHFDNWLISTWSGWLG